MAETVINNNIYFNGEGGQPGTPADPAPDENPIPKPSDPASPKGGFKRLAGIATAAQMGKSVLGYATSRVQMYTGSGDLQDKVNAGMGIAGTVGAIAANPAMGLAMTAFNLATKALDYMHKQKWDSLSVAEARKRAGPSLNKSRLGT